MAKIEINQGWGTMQLGIEKLKRILEGLPEPQFDSTKYMELYTTTYNMCTQKPPHDYSEELYDRYVNVFVSYLNSIVLPSLKSKHDEFMLRELMLRWANHKVMVRWLSRFFSYLDRYFCKKKNRPSLNDTGVICFRDNVFGDFKGQVGVEVLKIIEKEREGDKIDRGLLKNVIEIFVAVGLEKMDFYQEFEGVMLAESRAYYSRKASTWIVEDPCPAYMEKAENRLREEKERVGNYLHASTHDKLIGLVQKELLVAYSVQLLESPTGVGALLQDNKKDDISRMFRLFNDIPDGLAIVVKSFKQHIINEGNSLIQQAEAAPADGSAAAAAATDGFVRNLIDLHDKFTGYVTEAFGNNSAFHLAMKAAFEVCCNKNVAGSTSAELLASYLDSILKKGGGSEKLTDEEIETTLGKVVKLLDYVSEKDLFAEFHRKKLSRRLLFDKSVGEDYEKGVLQNLKEQLGGTFTAKMEGMVTDLALGRENQSQFAVFLNDYRTGIDLSVTVLTTGFWPTYKSSEINLPEEMAKSVQVYKNFYQLRTKSRKLTWIYSLGTCQVNAKFDQKMMELTVGVYQAAALLLFNHTDKLSYSEIRTQLNMGDEHLVRTLHSLSCGKYKVLIKEPNTKTVTAKDTFSYNSKFTDRMRRIKIPLPVVDDRKKVVEDVDKERRYAIDACIVRIMKSRKVLGHQLLVTECVEQLSKLFKPDFKVIKKRIESLISQEYLERDHDNPNQFRYLA